jgi:O-succinylbenzoic acid--CoA ligase
LGILGPDLVLLAEEMEPTPGDHRTLTIGASQHDAIESLGAFWPKTGPLPLDPDPDGSTEEKCAAHLLTSGTTGEPVKVSLTFGNLRANARGAQERLSLRGSDRWMASLSVAHVGGLALVTRAALLGSALHLGGVFRAGDLKRRILDGSVTHASLVPTMLHQLLEIWGGQLPPESLRCLLIGGAKAEPALLTAALDQGFPLALTYGLTEASSQVATAPPTLVVSKPGTVGPPLAGVELSLSAEGEILVGGPTVAIGRGDEGGWLHTGDFGRVDEDGHLWVTGRISHRIISGGVNIDPAEVEALLRTHPGVAEAVVLGIPDPVWGERVVAAVVPASGAGVRPAELERLTRATLSPAKRPRAIQVMDSLPRNPNGKVDRRTIRALLR